MTNVHIWGDININGTEFFRELSDGESCLPHPSGNGLVICHPNRPPVWCRMEADGMREDLISGTQTATEFIPDEPYTQSQFNPHPGPQSEFFASPLPEPVIYGRGF